MYVFSDEVDRNNNMKVIAICAILCSVIVAGAVIGCSVYFALRNPTKADGGGFDSIPLTLAGGEASSGTGHLKEPHYRQPPPLTARQNEALTVYEESRDRFLKESGSEDDAYYGCLSCRILMERVRLGDLRAFPPSIDKNCRRCKEEVILTLSVLMCMHIDSTFIIQDEEVATEGVSWYP